MLKQSEWAHQSQFRLPPPTPPYGWPPSWRRPRTAAVAKANTASRTHKLSYLTSNAKFRLKHVSIELNCILIFTKMRRVAMANIGAMCTWPIDGWLKMCSVAFYTVSRAGDVPAHGASVVICSNKIWFYWSVYNALSRKRWRKLVSPNDGFFPSARKEICNLTRRDTTSRRPNPFLKVEEVRNCSYFGLI